MPEKYVEIVYDNVSYRKGEVVKLSEYKPSKIDRVCYTTMFNYTDEIVNYLPLSVKKYGGPNKEDKNNGRCRLHDIHYCEDCHKTVKGYDGELYIPYLWIDIDDEDLVKATNTCRSVLEKINLKFGIEYESLAIFFSGGKGYHIGLHCSLFGGQDYSNAKMSSIARYFVSDILDIKSEDKVKLVDFRIYDSTRVFRAPYSKHNKNDNYKVDIDYNLIFEGNLDEILRLSRNCQRALTYQYKFKFNELLNKSFNSAIEKVNTESDNIEVQLDKSDLEENSSIFKIPQVGNRNNDLFRQAFRLFSVKDLKVNEVSDIMKFIFYSTNEIASKSGNDKISETELKLLLKSAYGRCRSIQKTEMSAISISSIAMKVYKAIKESKYANAIVDEFNSDLRGGYVVGNLYPMVGMQGTLKSIYCQEVAIQNALSDIDILYINAEMSEMAFFDRIYLRVFERSFIELIKTGEINESDIALVISNLDEKLKGRFHITNEVDLDAEDISGLISRKQDEIKRKISLSVMDSMNSMKMINNNEAQTAFHNTKYLKESAKKENYAMLLINHVTGGCEPLFRDVAGYVRGGPKVLQNGDAYISFSRLLNAKESNIPKKDFVYMSGMAYLRLINKRDTGNTIDKIISVDDTLRVSVSQLDPKKMEFYE